MDKLTDHLNMTIAVDWDIEQDSNKTNNCVVTKSVFSSTYCPDQLLKRLTQTVKFLKH